MRTPAVFTPRDPRAIVDLVRRHPLAQLVSVDGSDFEASPLPLVPDVDPDGRILSFIGHFDRLNPQVNIVRKQPRALAIFQGADGYVSSSWLRDRTQPPNWNFETAHFLVDIELTDTAEESAQAIEILLNAVEGANPQRWRSQELGARYDDLLKGVVGFRAKVLETRVKFKLGQNLAQDLHEDVVAGLRRTGNQRLATVMDELRSGCPRPTRLRDQATE